MISGFIGACLFMYSCAFGAIEYTISYGKAGLLVGDIHRAVYSDLTLDVFSAQLGIGAAWFDEYPEKYMTNPWQFHLFASQEVWPNIKIRYDHFSNGDKILHTGRPNHGINSVGVQYQF